MSETKGFQLVKNNEMQKRMFYIVLKTVITDEDEVNLTSHDCRAVSLSYNF